MNMAQIKQYAILQRSRGANTGSDGKTATVSGVVMGFLGIHKHLHTEHKSISLYHVTHIPTGYCLHRFWLESVAIACCQELTQAIGEKLNFTLEDIPKGAFANQIKTIIEKHDKTDDDRENHL